MDFADYIVEFFAQILSVIKSMHGMVVGSDVIGFVSYVWYFCMPGEMQFFILFFAFLAFFFCLVRLLKK